MSRESPRKWAQRLEDLITGLGSGNVDGPGEDAQLVDKIALWADTGGTLLKKALVSITALGSIVLPTNETVDGRDLSVDGAALDAHSANTSNPHSVDSSDVGLASVSNDAQLTRAAGDFGTFSAATPASSDTMLIEDADDSNNKKSVAFSAVQALASGSDSMVETKFHSSSVFQALTTYPTFGDSNLTLNITTTTGDILIIRVRAPIWGDFFGVLYLRITVDGVAIPQSIVRSRYADDPKRVSLSISRRVTGLSAGAHTVTVQMAAQNAAGGWDGTSGNAVLIVKRVRV